MELNKQILSEALALPAVDRLELIERLWDSFAEGPDMPDLTEAQRRELDRRIEEMDAHPEAGIPWEQVKAELRNKQ